MSAERKYARLLRLLRDLDGAVVAFSGGVDSTLLLAAAQEALGKNVLGVVARSATYTAAEERAARALARRLGVRLRVVETHELSDPAFRRNPPDRCYACKRELFGRLRGLARGEGPAVVLEGSNADDRRDWRPGRRAAEELGVRSPLFEVGLTKAEIRALVRARGLPNWDRPAQACLASRVPYGEEITAERLARIGKAEAALRRRGLAAVRVRDHGTTARIEVPPAELPRFLDARLRAAVVRALKSAGYTFVALDLEGYRTGAMTETFRRRGGGAVGVRRRRPGGRGIGVREAVALLGVEGPELYELLARAGRVRHERRGDVVHLCSIVNARSGHCGEDCAFCAQSRRARTEIARYPLLPVSRMLAGARRARADGAACFSIVTSGRTLGRRDLGAVAEALGRIAATSSLRPSASLGMLDDDALRRLRDAGLRRYHHNLEAAESFFPEICGTRRWRDGVETIRRAQHLGLQTCCGGIFGMGETRAQRVELLAALRELGVDSVPLNFLNPVAGTRLGDRELLEPFEALKVIAVARLMMPDGEIRVCGGRERVLRDLQSWIFLAGADGMMVGGYLTTGGRPVADDLRLIADAGMRLPGAAGGG